MSFVFVRSEQIATIVFVLEAIWNPRILDTRTKIVGQRFKNVGQRTGKDLNTNGNLIVRCYTRLCLLMLQDFRRGVVMWTKSNIYSKTRAAVSADRHHLGRRLGRRSNEQTKKQTGRAPGKDAGTRVKSHGSLGPQKPGIADSHSAGLDPRRKRRWRWRRRFCRPRVRVPVNGTRKDFKPIAARIRVRTARARNPRSGFPKSRRRRPRPRPGARLDVSHCAPRDLVSARTRFSHIRVIVSTTSVRHVLTTRGFWNSMLVVCKWNSTDSLSATEINENER